jgi:hypothetical protein
MSPPPYRPFDNTPPPYRPPLSSPPPPYRPQNAVSRVDEHEINTIVQRCLFETRTINQLELGTCHDNSECAICLLENVCHESNGGKISCCGNTYHNDCLKKWFNTGNHTCPTCRNIIR